MAMDVRVSTRYKLLRPKLPRERGRRQRASERTVTSQNYRAERSAQLIPASAGNSHRNTVTAARNALRLPGQDDARVHGARRRGHGARPGAPADPGGRRGGVRGGAGLRGPRERAPGRRGVPGERGRRGELRQHGGAHGAPDRGGARQRALGGRAGHGRGRARAGHARRGPGHADAARRLGRRHLRGRPRRRALGGGAPLGRVQPRAGAGLLDRLPPAYCRRDALQRRGERAVPPLRAPGVQRGGAGGGDRRRQAPRLLPFLPFRPLLRRPRRPRPVRRHHPRPHPPLPRPTNGEVDASGVRELRGVRGGRGVAGDAAGGVGAGLRGRVRVRAQRRPGQRLAVGAHPGRRPLRAVAAARRRWAGALLPGGGPVPAPPPARRRGREDGGDDAAAQVRAGPGVRGGGRVRGVPVAGEPRGGGGPAERQLGGAAPVAQPLHLLPRHRPLRRHRHQGHALRRHRRAHARLPHAQQQVGPEHVGGAAGGRDLLPGGAAPVLQALPGRAGGGRAGGAEQQHHRGMPRQRLRLQDVLPALRHRVRLGAPLRRHQVGPLRGPQGPLRPAGDPRPGPEDLPQDPILCRGSPRHRVREASKE